jgi:hypothetical protein
MLVNAMRVYNMRTIVLKEASCAFGAASVVLLAGGIVLNILGPSRFGFAAVFSWPGSKTVHVATCAALCFIAAIACAGFACIYTYVPFPFSKTIARWHFWLSCSGILLWGWAHAGLFISWKLIERHGDEHYYSPVVVTTTYFGFLLGRPALISGQLVFAAGVIHHFVKKWRRPGLSQH